VLDVSETYVIIRPHVHNKEIRISRKEIEPACKELLALGEITRIRIQEAYSEFHPAFVAAILAELPGVTHVVKPVITLYSGATKAAEPASGGRMGIPPKQPPAPPVAAPVEPSPEGPPKPPPDRRFRDRAGFGKRQEFRAIAELLKLGFDVYLPLVDDQGIDCVVRREQGDKLYYWDIQIKARSTEIKAANAGLFAALTIPKPRENYIFIFYAEQVDTCWVIPSLELVKLAFQNKGGKNARKYSIDLCHREGGKAVPDPRYRDYEDAFHLLDP
jgi:hypothetical protein